MVNNTDDESLKSCFPVSHLGTCLPHSNLACLTYALSIPYMFVGSIVLHIILQVGRVLVKHFWMYCLELKGKFCDETHMIGILDNYQLWKGTM